MFLLISKKLLVGLFPLKPSILVLFDYFRKNCFYNKSLKIMKTLSKLVPILTLVVVFLTSCSNEEKTHTIDPGFSEYISGFTSGILSKKSSFKIGLSKDSKMFTTEGAEITEDLFEFSPAVEGKAYWLSPNTIEFKPSELLESGKEYTVEFELGKVLDVQEKYEEFEFVFHTIKQNFEVKISGISTYQETDLVWNQLSGQVLFADVMADEEVEKIVEAVQNEQDLHLSWTHSEGGVLHHFTVDSVQRAAAEEQVELLWSGSDFSVDVEGELMYQIPSLSDFKVMNVEVFRSPDQYLLIHFSDPLDKKQNLDGLIHFKNHDELSFSIEGNTVKAYPKDRVTGTKTLVFEQGIKNILSYKLKEKLNYSLAFQDYKPDVQIIGNGVILPSTDGLVFPFKAVNLSAIDVKIIRIFENNVQQFLQVNNLQGNYQMKRVGRPVFNKKVNLVADNVIDRGIWNNYFLDLSELIETEPGAIYRVELDFKKAYSLYPCEDENGEEEEEVQAVDWDEADDQEDYYYDYYEDDYYYDYDYNWKERDDPCKKSYYTYRSAVAKNVIASNIGVIAKRGSDRKLTVAVTDIRTTEPLNNIEIELYNYQNQLITTKKTGSDGLLELELKGKPFLLVAKNGDERGYLKLDDGSALSTSKFDVRGEKVQKGVKGFIYGERGVWRPGDTLFLNFILEDREALLPENHPVKFELFNPQGQLVHQQVSVDGLDGFYNFTVTTDDDAPTGSWLAKVKVGGAKFQKYLRIEAIKPNRLKVKLDFGDDIISAQSPNINGKLSVKWLHGAIAKNLKAKIGVTLYSSSTVFKKYEDFNFSDPSKHFESQEQDLFDGKVNDLGEANINGKIKLDTRAPGLLRASFLTRVFEKGGDFSTDKFSMPYSPYDSYVGVRLPKGDRRGTLVTDTNHIGDLQTVDYKGNPVAVANLEVRVYKVRWRWWWESSNESIGSFINNRHVELVQTTKASTNSEGKGSFEFRVKGDDWGRYFVQVKNRISGHTTGKYVYFDWPGWMPRGKRNNPGGASLLSFTSDKDQYKVGEKAMISIPTSGKGRALLTVESGSKVLKAEWIEVNNTEVLHQVEITPEMAPNVYVHVTMLQPHQHDNSLPIRMYGVIPLLVEDPQTILKPIIEMPKELAPLSEATVQVSEQNGKAMTYTLAIVDEGLLDLTRFSTPNPHPVFYAREALGVKTWDFYDYVVGAYGGKLEGVLSIGGDEGMNSKEKNKVKRFKPMVRFVGPFELKSGEKATHNITIPNYIGSVRTMVIAGKDRAYGCAEETTPVKKPLMVLASLPRVLGPDEVVKLPVTVFAMDKNVKQVKVKVVTNKAFKSAKVQTKTIQFNEIGDQVVNFDLTVSGYAGAGKVQVFVESVATSNVEKASTEVDIQVRHANPKQTKVFDATFKKGEQDTVAFRAIGMKGTNEIKMEVSSIPAINLEKRLGYLIGYPHGCVEQTTSKAFPQLYLGDLMKLDAQKEEAIAKNVMSAINKLRSFQRGTGGFGYWPSSQNISDYGTTYAGHFLIEAKRKGYTVPERMFNDWVSYQRKAAKNYSSFYSSAYGSYFTYSRANYDFAQAYRLYVLALAGKAEIGAMNRLKESNLLDYIGMHRLAASYYLIGEKQIAANLLKGLTNDGGGRRYYGYSYGSPARDQAILLETLHLMGKEKLATEAMKNVASSLGDGSYLNTQAVAYSLMGLSKYIGESGISKELKFSVWINGKKENHQVSGALGQLSIPLSTLNGANNEGVVQFKNTGEGMLFVNILSTGIPAPGDELVQNSKLSIETEFMDIKGNYLDVTRLEQGTDFMVEVTVSNQDLNNPVDNIALSHVFPSGWEIFNQRMFGEENDNKDMSIPDYQDVRDDRVLTYFGLSDYRRRSKYSTKTFRIVLNASYLGKFYLPSVYAESMYDDNYKAAVKGKWVEVVEAGK